MLNSNLKRWHQRGSVAAQAVPGLVTGVLLAAAPQTGDASPGTTWSEPHEVAAGEAFRGPWRMNDSEFRYVDDPSAAFDADGDLGLVWADQEAQEIRFQRFGPDGESQLEDPVNVSSSPEIFSWHPRVRLDGDHVYVLWQEIVFSGGSHGGEAFFARSTDGGETFSEPVNLSETTHGVGKGRLTRTRWHNGSHDLALGPGGSVHLAWTAFEGGLYYTRSDDRGQNFSEPVHVAGDDELPARGPSLAAGEDEVAMAWTVGEDESADIRVARSRDGDATFGERERATSSEAHADAPSLEQDGDGRLHLAFADSPDGPFGQYRVRYAQAPGGSLEFSEPETIADGRGDADSVSFPSLAIGDEGRLHLLWERFPQGSDRPRGLGYTTAAGPEAEFAAPKVVPGSDDPAHGFNGSLQGLLMDKLAAGPDGAVAVVNSTYRDGEASRIWLHLGGRTGP